VGGVDSLLHFWWLIFPLGGVIGGGVRAISAANERRAERRLERYRIKQQTKIAMAQASSRPRDDEALRRRELQKVIEKVIATHTATDDRWLDYELDVAKLLDFPVMTDLRDPLTVAFHKAKRQADLLRPDTVDDILGDRAAQLDYRDAVHEYVSAFDIAEAEAIRRRRSDFSSADQERLARAQRLLRLAGDSGATPQERQNAYARARTELDGLIALPAAAVASIERTIAGELER
jgi:hypothetical protein